jgi:hypothetical protein
VLAPRPRRSYGTLTFTNAGANTVDIGVSLNGGLPLSVQDIFLNYNQVKFNSTSMFTATVTGASPTVTNSENGLTVNGSGNYPGKFDLSISKLTQGGADFTIVLSAIGLTAIDLVGFLDTAGNFDAAVHWQNCGPNGNGTCQPGQTGNNSLVVGELLPAPPIGRGLPVLLAVGGLLFGAKLVERSKARRRSLGTATPNAAA